jgi:O-antigen biosynthesis protein
MPFTCPARSRSAAAAWSLPPLLRRIRSLGALPRKAAEHARLMLRDPERFGRNLLQFTNPRLFEQRLADVLDAVPMHVSVDPAVSGPPHLNVLNSALTRGGMTGGPNTVINLALRIARLGVPVRLITTVATSTMDPTWFRAHVVQLVGDPSLPDVPVVTAAEAARPLRIGQRDIFLATHWTTAQQLKAVLPRMAVRQFFYMLQEFEPGFYPWSSNYALALETYYLDFWPIFNEALLAKYILGQGIGRFADPAMRGRATVFEPAIEERLFHPPPLLAPTRPRRLLFYARPSNTRNMFGLGLTALRRASNHATFAGWQFRSIGGRGSVPPLPLEGGHLLWPEPWMDYETYSRSLRQADVLLCPMLSPHTSYPVLEMAASGGLSVTNTFATKTREALKSLSDNIVATEPTVEAMAEGLIEAAKQVCAGRLPAASINMARTWSETLDPAAARVADLFRQMASLGQSYSSAN